MTITTGGSDVSHDPDFSAQLTDDGNLQVVHVFDLDPARLARELTTLNGLGWTNVIDQGFDQLAMVEWMVLSR